MRGVLRAAALIFLLAQPVAAQSTVVRGTVREIATRAPVSGAEVRVVAVQQNESREFVFRTDSLGGWSAQLSPGSYDVLVRAVGFLTASKRISAEQLSVTVLLSPTVRALNAIVVTAAARQQRLKDVVVTTELVTREDIERSGASDIAAVLTEQTGVDLQGGHPAGAGVMLQGLGSERVLILLDGQPLVGRISGVSDISRIPAAIVERVEIVKGPQSTIYGSQAMGGVINVITRAPEAGLLDVAASARAGSQARREFHGRINYGRSAIAASIDGGFRGENVAPGVSSAAGALARRTDFSAALRISPRGPVSIIAALVALDERQRWRSGSVYQFSDNVEMNGRVAANIAIDDGELSATVFTSSYNHLSRGSVLPQPIAGDPGERQIQRLHRAELLYSQPLGATGQSVVNAGLHAGVEEIETTRVDGSHRSATSVEPFAQLDLPLRTGLTLVPGVRASLSSKWGTQVTPRVAARLQLSESFTIRASVAQGYRAPDLKEQHLFFQNTSAGYAVYGNPDLRPETSVNYSLGAEWGADRYYARVQGYRTDFSDFIETHAVSAPGEPLIFEYANVSSGMITGAEFEVGATLASLRVESAVGILSTRDDATGRELLGRPRRTARISLGFISPVGTTISLTSTVTGRTPMQRDENSGTIAAWRAEFFRSDLNVTQRLARDFSVSAGADNLFDKRVGEWAGFTSRRTYAGITWRK